MERNIKICYILRLRQPGIVTGRTQKYVLQPDILLRGYITEYRMIF